MIFGQPRFGIIQTTKCDIDFFRKLVKLTRQWCPARGAKTARALGRGSKPPRLTRQEPETDFGHAEPSDEGGSAGASTNRTVAIGFMKRGAFRLVADGPTKTPTVHHTLIPFKLTTP